jgi:glutaredoxin-like protein
MAIIGEQDRLTLSDLFARGLAQPVKLVLFTQRQSPLIIPGVQACELCEQSEQLVKEVAEHSDKLSAEIYDFSRDEESAKAYGVDKIPGIALIGAKDYGVRFYGFPGGYEFSALIEAIMDVSRGNTGLATEVKEQLQALSQDVHIQVFSTPTCPYCSRAVRIAHQMAVESDHVCADAIEATEFPDLVDRYAIRGVPKIVLNETRGFEGALPAAAFLRRVLEAGAAAETPV